MEINLNGNFFNLYYWIPIALTFIILFIIWFIFKNKTYEQQNKLIIILLFFNLFFHLTKLFFEPYLSGLPSTIRNISFENICAVSTLIFPFLYLSKNRILKDYLYYFGLLGGLAALFIPTEALNQPFFTYDTIRFYIVHSILLIAPILMMLFKLHKINYKKYWQTLVVFVVVLIIIMVNEWILGLLGWVDMTLFFDRGYRNSSFIFGPTPMFDKVANYIIDPLVPNFLRKDYFNLGIVDFYFPILWMTGIIVVYGSILLLGLASLFDYQTIKDDFIKIFKKKEKRGESI